MYGGYRNNRESRFINEIDQDLLNIQGVRKVKLMSKEKKIDFVQKRKKASHGMSAGAKVKHGRYGDGVIINIDGDFCQVAFEAQYGIKKVDANYLTLKQDKQIHLGTKIVHSRFGEGVIVKIEGDSATIAFNAHGIKKLDINHPAITIK